MWLHVLWNGRKKQIWRDFLLGKESVSNAFLRGTILQLKKKMLTFTSVRFDMFLLRKDIINKKKKKGRIRNCKEVLENLWESWCKMCLVRMCPWALICHVHMAPNRAPAASTLNLEESFICKRMNMDRVKKSYIRCQQRLSWWKKKLGLISSQARSKPYLILYRFLQANWSCADSCLIIFLWFILPTRPHL